MEFRKTGGVRMTNYKSRRIYLLKITLFVLVMLFTISSCQTSADETSKSTAVVEGFVKAQNAGDVEASLAFLADDAVIQFVPPPIPEDDGVFTGNEEIRGWYENVARNKGHSELSNVQINRDVVTALLTYSDDGLKQIGLDSIDNEWTVTVKDGLIQGYKVTMTDESFEKLMAASTAAQAE
jgi:ketosteroid isomerase-like protein